MADYRELADEPFDAVASIGMVEHVGANQIDVYARQVARLVKPGGRILNHGIARLRHTDAEAGPFSERYVFPDAAPLHLSRIQLALERAGIVTEHVEGLRSDYAETLRALGAQPRRATSTEATRLAGPERMQGVAALPARGPPRVRERIHVDLSGARAASLTGSPHKIARPTPRIGDQ